MRVTSLLALALVLAAFAVAAPGDDREARAPAAGPLIAASGGTGSLSLSNSLGAGAILSVTGLAPGGSTQGQVVLANRGTLTGALTLKAVGTTEVAGGGGGRLSQRLVLEVLEPTGATIYRGPVAGLGTRQLGRLGPGAARRFRFRATLPDGGLPLGPASGDNAYQGASLSTGFRWTAVASGGGTPPGGSPGPGPIGPVPRLGLRVAPVKRQPALRRGRLVLRVRCSRECAVAARATVAKRGGRSRTSRKATLPANRSVKLTLRFSRRVTRRLTRAAGRRAGARLALRVKARTADGDSASLKRGLRLRTVRRGGRRLTRAGWTRVTR